MGFMLQALLRSMVFVIRFRGPKLPILSWGFLTQVSFNGPQNLMLSIKLLRPLHYIIRAFRLPFHRGPPRVPRCFCFPQFRHVLLGSHRVESSRLMAQGLGNLGFGSSQKNAFRFVVTPLDTI